MTTDPTDLARIARLRKGDYIADYGNAPGIVKHRQDELAVCDALEKAQADLEVFKAADYEALRNALWLASEWEKSICSAIPHTSKEYRDRKRASKKYLALKDKLTDTGQPLAPTALFSGLRSHRTKQCGIVNP